MRFWDYVKARIITSKNAEAPPGKHWNLTEGDYVDNPTAEGYTWSNDTYRLEPNP